jgi:hypothetical protein
MQVITMLKQKIWCAQILVRKKLFSKTILHNTTFPFLLLIQKKVLYGSSAFVRTSFVIFPKAAYVSSLTSFNRKMVLFLATKPLTCAHINSIGLSLCQTGVLNT